MTKHITPVKAIRLKCLDCCAYQPSKVRHCMNLECSLHPYRMGKRPKVSQSIKQEGKHRGSSMFLIKKEPFNNYTETSQ